MLLLIVITALLCTTTMQAVAPIEFFFPDGSNESSCTDANSWTDWFNSAQPKSDPALDREMLATIRVTHADYVCADPLGMQAQSIGEIPNVDSYTCSWAAGNNIVTAFRSNIPGLDFQVRFCCPNNTDDTATATTIIPSPVTNSTCGRAEIKHSLKSSRIFGGTVATPNSWPWQVLYEQIMDCGDGVTCSGVCGGTLIDSHHVLTAAHCVGTTDGNLITVTAGLHNKYADEAETRQIRTVGRVFKHSDYNPDTIQNDIAVLRLSRPVQFNKYVQPACLPGPDPKTRDDVVLIGWGAIEADKGAYYELKQTKVQVIGNCQRYWGQVDDEKQVCVGDPFTLDSVCPGDSGGPMLYEHNGQWIVAGITSYISISSCSPGSVLIPNVYTRVSAYLPWINSIISNV